MFLACGSMTPGMQHSSVGLAIFCPCTSCRRLHAAPEAVPTLQHCGCPPQIWIPLSLTLACTKSSTLALHRCGFGILAGFGGGPAALLLAVSASDILNQASGSAATAVPPGQRGKAVCRLGALAIVQTAIENCTVL